MIVYKAEHIVIAVIYKADHSMGVNKAEHIVVIPY
jgi:hypothetical protein